MSKCISCKENEAVEAPALIFDGLCKMCKNKWYSADTVKKSKKIITDAFDWLLNIDESACSCDIGETNDGQPFHTEECIKVSSSYVKKLLKECGFEVCWRCNGLGSIEKDEAIENCPACEGKGYIHLK